MCVCFAPALSPVNEDAAVRSLTFLSFHVRLQHILVFQTGLQAVGKLLRALSGDLFRAV